MKTSYTRFCAPGSLVFVFVLLLGICASAADNLPSQTIVVFSAAVPDAGWLAKFYAQKHGIADDHLVQQQQA